MRWTVHGERFVYESPWVNLSLVDVEIPGERRFEHHVIRMPADAAGTIMHDPEKGVLLLWRHRFISDTWGWEIPAGRVEPGEEPAEAAAREALEESGWRPGPLDRLTSYRWATGLSDGSFHLFLAHGAHQVGKPTDTSESERIEWKSVDEVRALLEADQIADGLTMTALLWALAFDRIS